MLLFAGSADFGVADDDNDNERAQNLEVIATCGVSDDGGAVTGVGISCCCEDRWISKVVLFKWMDFLWDGFFRLDILDFLKVCTMFVHVWSNL